MTRQWENLRREYEQIKFQEKSRFDILHAAHKQGATTSRKLSVTSFTGIDQRSDEFQVQLTNLMRKFMILAKDDPLVLKTVLQIIQEEERCDRDYVAYVAKMEDFEIVGRPKQWKVKTWEGFKHTINNRIAQIPKDAPENWLALHLERLRQAVISDLLEIKQVCVPLCPDDWDVYKDCVVCYHESITKHLEDIVSGGLEKAEMTQILVWVNEYTGSALLKNTTLAISDSEYLGAPLSYQTLTTLRQRYLDEIGSNLGDWLPKTLKKDVTDWSSDSEPQRHDEGYYYTDYPVLTFRMINENIEQASHVRDDIKNNIVNTSLKELQANLQEYTSTVTEYINKWGNKHKPNNQSSKKKSTVEQPKCPAFYIQHTIAILNNFCLVDRNLNQLKDKFGLSDVDHEKQLANLKSFIDEQSRECLHLFLITLQAQMKQHHDRILTKQWLDNSAEEDAIGAICQLIHDHTSGMRVHYFTTWIRQIEKYITQEYIKAMMEKRMVCKSDTDRKAVACKIYQDVDKLRDTFTSLSGVTTDQKSTEWEVVTKLAEIIEVEKTTVNLQITCLVNLYGDVQRKHLSRILRIRGDFGNTGRKKMVADALRKPEINANEEKVIIKQTIFSAVQVK
ncbi:exocyst complex component 3-like isoform X2 [Amphiura filiformis]